MKKPPGNTCAAMEVYLKTKKLFKAMNERWFLYSHPTEPRFHTVMLALFPASVALAGLPIELLALTITLVAVPLTAVWGAWSAAKDGFRAIEPRNVEVL